MYDELVKTLRCCGSDDRCKGCPRENGKGKCYDDICIEAADAIEELSRLNAEITRRELKLRMEKPRWIPVTERLPEDLTVVLVVEDGTVFMAHCEHYYGEEEVYVEWHDTRYYPVSPTHWMPLPQPPEEEN